MGKVKLVWFWEAVKLKVDRRRGLAALKAAKALLDKANETVPERDGDLMRSGTASVDMATGKAAVSYDTPYAKRQHEDLTLHHTTGRAKWLQRAQDEQAVPLIAGMGAEIAEELL